jgi:hypothetical protein
MPSFYESVAGGQEIYTSGPKAEFRNTYNVLNNYRNYTYRFTLCAIPPSDLNEPSKWRNENNKFVIIQSGGKRPNQFNGQDQAPSNDTATEQAAAQKAASDVGIPFDSASPGARDLFLEDVEIDSLFSFSQASTVSLPTNITFKVIEPYSINGFLEALHVGALWSGCVNYASAIFMLKVDFIGYPDPLSGNKDILPNPEIIDQTTRYFPIIFKSVNLEVTEKGAVYECAAVPINDSAFGNSNLLKKSINMKGNRVGELLRSFVSNINSVYEKDAEDTYKDKKYADVYKVSFPSINPDGTLNFEEGQENEMFKSKLATDLRDPAVVGMEDPQTTKVATTYNNDPKKVPESITLNFYDGDKVIQTVESPTNPDPATAKPNPATAPLHRQIAEKTNIHDAMAAVIRDSDYAINILKGVQSGDKDVVDEYGFVNYFVIHIRVHILSAENIISPYTLKPKQMYEYVISPYRVHVSNLPGMENKAIDFLSYKKIINREYNYIYTGKNLDILKFNLKFDSQYFQAMPAGIINEVDPAKTSAAPSGENNVTATGADPSDTKARQVPNTQMATQTVDTVPEGGTGNVRSTNPYTNLARLFHSALVNNVKGMSTGNIEILGDPFYIVTGALGNYYPEKDEPLSPVTKDGEAAYMAGQVSIQINFQSPKDVSSSFDKTTDLMVTEPAPFSGIYQVSKVVSRFVEGAFTQRLDIFRIPGQPDATKTNTPTNLADTYKTESNPVNEVQQDVTDAVKPISLKLPELKLPETNISFASVSLTAKSPLSATAGATAAASSLQSASGISSENALGTISSAVNNAVPSPGALIDNPSLSTGIDSSLSAVSQIKSEGSSAAQLVGNVRDNLRSAVSDAANSLTDSVANAGAALANAASSAVADAKAQFDQLKNIAANIPKTVDIAKAKAQGIALDLVPADKLANLPSTPPVVKAPSPVIDKVFLRETAKKGVDSVKKMFGAKNLSDISLDLVPADELTKIKDLVPKVNLNPLAGSANFNQVDIGSVTGKLGSVSSQVASVANFSSNASSALNNVTAGGETPISKLMLNSKE